MSMHVTICLLAAVSCVSVFLSTVCVIDWYLRVGWLWIKEQKWSLQDFLLPDEKEDENGLMMRFAMRKLSLQRNRVRYMQSLLFHCPFLLQEHDPFRQTWYLTIRAHYFAFLSSIIQSNYLLVVKNGWCDDDASSSYSCRSKEKRLRRGEILK